MRRALDIVVALASAALLLLAVLFYRDDITGRASARDFVRKFNVEKRRPEVAQTIGYAPSPDWNAMIIADAALRDAYEPVNLTDVAPDVREAWINAAAQFDDELRFSRGALLDAIAMRPGWPFYQSLLGQTVFAIDSRSRDPDLVKRPETWTVPLLDAARGAPQAASPWRSLAAGYLQTWPVLASVHSATAGEVFAHAFEDPDFVRNVFPDTARLLGPDRAISYVPDAPQSLRAAFDDFARANDVAHAWPLRQRWDAAEWSDRVHDLAEIDRHARRGDVDEVRSLCDQWTLQHSVWDFDSPAAHAQAARVLELWPGGRRAAWANDPLADIARYLLTRNGDGDPYAGIVARQIDSFAGVAAEVVAEVKLRAGDVNGAERIAQSAEDARSLDWAPYYLTLADRDNAHAAEALARMPAAAMETHEARIVRGLENDDSSALQSCGANNEIAVHGARNRRQLRVIVTTQQQAIVDIGINRARSATLLVNGSRDISFTLIGWRDKTLFTRALCGTGESCVNVIPGTVVR